MLTNWGDTVTHAVDFGVACISLYIPATVRTIANEVRAATYIQYTFNKSEFTCKYVNCVCFDTELCEVNM